MFSSSLLRVEWSGYGETRMTNEKFMTVGTNGGHKVVDVVISSNEFLILRDDGKINQFGLGDISNTNIFHNN